MWVLQDGAKLCGLVLNLCSNLCSDLCKTHYTNPNCKLCIWGGLCGGFLCLLDVDFSVLGGVVRVMWSIAET